MNRATKLARGIVCKTAVAVLQAAGANPSGINIQTAMDRCTDVATAQIEGHGAETRRRIVKEICMRRVPTQLELDV
jgi:hypothetical protein